MEYVQGIWAENEEIKINSQMAFSLVLGDRLFEFSGTMTVSVDITMFAAAVFPHYSDTHDTDVKIKMLMAFVPIDPPTSR